MPGTRTKKAGEASNETFVRLANSRTNKVLRQLTTLKGLTNYESTPAQRSRIIDAIASKVKEVDQALANPKAAKTVDSFKL